MSIINAVGRDIFRLGFEISPIILHHGIAVDLPGSILPIVALTEGPNLLTGLLSGSDFTLDNAFAHYRPLPGTTLFDLEFGQYPFANQATAANAIITRPLRVSLLMECPVRHAGGYASKFLTINLMKSVLDIHHSRGGSYMIATPSYLYVDCLLRSLRDAGGEGSQAQTTWQWDFEQPLIALSKAESAQNAAMSKLGPNGTRSTGQTSGFSSSVGSSGSGAGQSILPSASGVSGAFVGSFKFQSMPVVLLCPSFQ